MRVCLLVTKSFVLLIFSLAYMFYHHLLSVYCGVHLTLAAPGAVAVELVETLSARLSWMSDCAPWVNLLAVQTTYCAISSSRLQMPSEMIVEMQLAMAELHEDHACVIPVPIPLHQFTWKRLGGRQWKAPTSVYNNSGILVTWRGQIPGRETSRSPVNFKYLFKSNM